MTVHTQQHMITHTHAPVHVGQLACTDISILSVMLDELSRTLPWKKQEHTVSKKVLDHRS